MVSIVVPVYNVERYLDACVQSALRLKTDCEILLIDDGSTDGSGACCDRFAAADPRVRVFHQKNGGLSAARNTGIRNSTGDYILFLDSDDFLDPAATDAMLAQCGQSAVLTGLYRTYDSRTGQYRQEVCKGLLRIAGTVPIGTFLSAVPKDGQSCYMIAGRFVVRREFLLANGLLFHEGIYHEDEEWTQRLLCAADSVTVTHAYFYQYRQGREGAITESVKPKHVFDTFTILRCAQALLHTSGLTEEKAAYVRQRMAGLYLNNLINYSVLPEAERGRARALLREFHDGCAPNLCGKRGTPVRLCDRIFGLRVTLALLGAANRLRGRGVSRRKLGRES